MALDVLRGQPYWAERMAISGVPNAGRVDGHLYRGGQPSEEGLRSLKDLGVGTVVSLTLGHDEVSHEKDSVEALGMRYVHLPWSTEHDPPTDDLVAFLKVLRAPERPVFVHCKAGVDRTGVMVAAYRIAIQKWTPADALAEMNAFHFHYVFIPHLARYVDDLPAMVGRLGAKG